jgi:hypothetical protein
MANNKSDNLEQFVLNTFLQQGSWTGGPLEIALYTTLPDEDEQNGVEVSGGSYARQAISFDVGPSLDGNNDYFVTHSATISYPVATANWGTIVGIGIHDTLYVVSLYYGALGTSQVVNTSDQVVFAPGSIVVTEQ